MIPQTFLTLQHCRLYSVTSTKVNHCYKYITQENIKQILVIVRTISLVKKNNCVPLSVFSQKNNVGIAPQMHLDNPEFDSQKKQEIFSLSKHQN
jgi:hypothetical protein